MFYIGAYIRVAPPEKGVPVPPAGYVAIVAIYLFAVFFQFGWVSILFFFFFCFFLVLVETRMFWGLIPSLLLQSGTGLLDLRLGDSYCSTACTQRLYCSSDTMAVQFRRGPSNSDDDCDGG